MKQVIRIGSMINKKQDKEYRNFNSTADEWWLENGKFSILHKINPLRIRYILRQIFRGKKKSKGRTPLKGLKIIDVGCGGGLVCEPLAKLGADMLGVDFVKKNIDVAKKHAIIEGLKIKYISSDIKNLKLKGKYDVIIILEVIEHITDWNKIILGLDKHLNSKGLLIVSSINRNIISRLMAIIVAENILNWIPKGTHKYQKLVKPEEIKKLLESINYKVVDISGMIYNPIINEWALSKNKTKINYFCTAIKN
ncbi:MAG: Ubiquinone biosynthesis O-methyltransferase [Alphaproteobacteria bacterium MarineAlpha5_Bin11]|nr:bifunctional 3-demethylubiquinol 3-O-methyltransferase/2-polyprenyl-6-hydroxyphenol methylase [Pelagibacteraceae bacterium]PPR44515.1 MAG: Ubiquinone biosynthesis O-methyltransferase [Alphaproteobacteria bacterium MarineAlpha5_Bin11]PPR50333.1 MAG: Ubiquinone biosynthesis O-methyltransferase [Alphaproteobacteria bacterium MarineAlpha5_Bin10]|tara:strand:- start:4521 stop:5276 length:756 start_codon:yes stop_codon:yes gene_type:complete